MTDAERAALVRRLHQEVSEGLEARLGEDASAGRARMSRDDQRAYSARLVNEALDVHTSERIRRGARPLTGDEEEAVKRGVRDAMFGLGGLQRLLDDETVENIEAIGCDRVFVTHSDGTITDEEPIAATDEEMVQLIRTLAAREGLSERRFDSSTPHLILQLRDGSRLFAVMAVTARPCLSIRRHRFPKVFLSDLVGMGMLSEDLGKFLQASVRARMNCIICGGTNAGKTTLLRALLNEVGPEERIVTIEDSFELGLDRYPELHPNVVAMEAREPNVEGEGQITMADLVRMGLRMNPDRVIVGEVRGDEVLPMLNAMSQGNDGSMCTIHADSSLGAFSRIAMYAVQSPQRLDPEATNLVVANALDLVIHIDQQSPTLGRGRERYVASVREVRGAEGPLIESNEIYRPGPGGRAVRGVQPSPGFVDALERAGYVTRRGGGGR
jgi:Flp pilus assembly CpaF family ATPase